MRQSLSMCGLLLLSACGEIEFDDRKRPSTANRSAECLQQGIVPSSSEFEDCMLSQDEVVDWDNTAGLYHHLRREPSNIQQTQCHSSGKRTQCLRY